MGLGVCRCRYWCRCVGFGLFWSVGLVGVGYVECVVGSGGVCGGDGGGGGVVGKCCVV